MNSERQDLPFRIVSLADEGGPDPEVLRMTPAERIELLWHITRLVWKTHHGDAELRLRRDVARLVRRAG